MVGALEIPFVSEAYDRLRAAQNAASAVQALARPAEPLRTIDLGTPVTDIRAARERMGVTQAAFAEKLGVDAPRISQMENGKPIPLYIDLACRCLLALEAIK